MKTEKLFEEELERLFKELRKYPMGSPEFYDIADAIDKLCDARSKKSVADQRLETIMQVATNLLVVGMILAFERTGILTTKAMSFLKRS